jgi:cysteinyl-tRNA synthetase
MIKNQLQLTNTLTGKKEAFIPSSPNVVKMYVCGVTPYDNAHIGHGRVYVTFDLLYRLLKYLEYDVLYCRNFTDIDDKLLNKAQVEFNDKLRYSEIAERYINSFHKDMKSLNCLSPDYEPRVTQTIPEIIRFIEGLIEKGMAYVSNGDVYYEVRKFSDYGKLSKRKLEDLKAGARVEIDESKKDPLDFALWKSETEGTFWKSPWGWGRPGWHIECSAMALKFLGEFIDIHGGGMDLIFPHHENEIAQTEGLFGSIFARYWMHNAFVKIDKQKMSKSLGNFFTLKDVFEKFDPMVIRFYYLNHNYGIPIDFSFDELERTQKNYQKLCKFFDSISTKDIDLCQIKESNIINKLIDFLCDDLNVAGMFGAFYENLALLEKDKKELQFVKAFFQQILGLELIPLQEKKLSITPEIQALIDEREQARKMKDWKKSDEIRDKLKEIGYEVHDKQIK